MNHDDIELGDTPIHVERQPRAGIVVSVRFDADRADALEALADHEGRTLSELVYDSALFYRFCHRYDVPSDFHEGDRVQVAPTIKKWGEQKGTILSVRHIARRIYYGVRLDSRTDSVDFWPDELTLTPLVDGVY